MTYQEKKAIADAYIKKQLGEITLSDLCDRVILALCNTEEDIISLCNQMITELGFDII